MKQDRKELARRLLRGRTGKNWFVSDLHRPDGRAGGNNVTGHMVYGPATDPCNPPVYQSETDAELIAEAPSLLEEALDEIERLEKALYRQVEKHLKDGSGVDALVAALDATGMKISFDPKNCCHPEYAKDKDGNCNSCGYGVDWT